MEWRSVLTLRRQHVSDDGISRYTSFQQDEDDLLEKMGVLHVVTAVRHYVAFRRHAEKEWRRGESDLDFDLARFHMVNRRALRSSIFSLSAPEIVA